VSTDGKPREIRWSWASDDNDLRTGYMAVDGRISIADLIEHMRAVAPGVDVADIQVNWATVVWRRQATPEEIVQRRQAQDRLQARHEEWERKTLARLIGKYGDGEWDVMP
jgi:heme exporter protein D